MNNTIALLSSARRHGNTGQLLDNIANKVEMELIYLEDQQLLPFDYDNKHKHDDFLPLIEKVLTYDKIIFASPVYWYSVSPAMKVFLDRISDLLVFPELLDTGRHLRGKHAYLVSTHDHFSQTFVDVFLQTFHYLGIQYEQALHIACKEGFDFNESRQAIDDFSKALKAQKTSI